MRLKCLVACLVQMPSGMSRSLVSRSHPERRERLSGRPQQTTPLLLKGLRLRVGPMRSVRGYFATIRSSKHGWELLTPSKPPNACDYRRASTHVETMTMTLTPGDGS